MSKFGFTGQEYAATDPQVARAYCAGRAASYASTAISANPHTSNTPEWQAWRCGHVSYASAGANTVADSCANPAKFANPAVTAVEDSADISGETWKFTPASPGLPFYIEFGDGTGAQNPAASTAALLHTYPASGDYLTRLHYMSQVWDAETITVAFVDPDVTAAVDETDVTGATWDFTPAAPGLAFILDFGDGETEENTLGSEVAISHVYAESGDYDITLLYRNLVWPIETITVTIVPEE